MDDEERFQKLREDEINRLIESGGSADPVKGILTPNTGNNAYDDAKDTRDNNI